MKFITFLILSFSFSTNLFSNSDRVKKIIEDYNEEKKELIEDYLEDLERKRERVLDAFEYEIKKLTRKGDLEAANKALTAKKSWEKANAIEVPGGVVAEAAANPKEVKNDPVYKFLLKHSQSWSYRQTANNVSIDQVLCSDKTAEPGSKVKIIGTYETVSHDEGKLSVTQDGNLVGDKTSALFIKGKRKFFVEGTYLQKGQPVKISIYPDSRNGVGQVVIMF